MNDERVVEDIVTKFLVDTCRLRPQLTRPAIEAALQSATLATVIQTDGEVDYKNPMTTGSVAEFYIEPMLPHVGDVDVMFHLSTVLAIPRGHPPPTQLPAEFHDYVQVYEIIDSHLHGYVYLKLCYLLRECIDDGNYNAVECDEQLIKLMSNRYYNDGNAGDIHGPALYLVCQGTQLPTDCVFCVRCLVWPSQAADWPTRPRNCGWPDSATVDRVVGNGCDLVGVAHRQCREHEWMGERQWRLSFSRAEIVLILSLIHI